MRATLILLLAIATLAPPAFAQPETQPATRAEALRQAREEKQQSLTPNRPDTLQRSLDFVEDKAIFLLSRDGFHPKLGSLTTGSGFAFGVGFRNRAMFAHRGAGEIWAAGSLKQYWALEGRAVLTELAGGRVMAEIVAGLREYPRESYFGLGPDSRREDRTSFSLRTPHVSARAGVRLAPVLRVGGGFGLLMPRAGDGQDKRLPGIGDVFTPDTAPALGQDIDYARTFGFVEVDYREPLNARRGGWYRLDVSEYHDRDGDQWTFTRTDLDLRQYIGFFADRRVIALRGFLSTSHATGGGRGLPFYLMPSLGGNESLRGFRDYRFRGPHALLMQAEYRWELWSGLDAALFYDAGKVGMRRSDLGLEGLESDYGFGFRFNTAQGVVVRIDAAFGSRAGNHLHIVFGGVF